MATSPALTQEIVRGNNRKDEVANILLEACSGNGEDKMLQVTFTVSL
jgi:hypothetical protein